MNELLHWCVCDSPSATHVLRVSTEQQQLQGYSALVGYNALLEFESIAVIDTHLLSLSRINCSRDILPVALKAVIS